MMKWKYIHVMSHSSVIFNTQVIHMINDNQNILNASDHLFVISTKNVYDINKEYKNVVYEENISSDKTLFLKYANMCNFIFLHNNSIGRMPVHLNKNILNKIIWCEWGHDLFSNNYYHDIPKNFIQRVKNIIKFLPRKYLNYKMRQFYAIGIVGDKLDTIEAKCEYGRNMKILMTPYGYNYNHKEEIEKYSNNICFNKDSNNIKVMIGHSAYPFLKHKKILDLLSKFKNENIIISLVFVYGNMDYAKDVEQYAIDLFGKDKIEIVKDRMTKDDYNNYLSTVDIGIFDYRHQSALGNFYTLLSLGKKVYLARDGYLKLICTVNSIESYNVEDISFMSFDEFIMPVKNAKNGLELSKRVNNEDILNTWSMTMNELEKSIDINEKNISN